MLIPIIAAVATAVGIILDKVILSKWRVDYRTYTVVLFIFLVVICLALYPFLGKINPQALEFKYLVFMGLVVILAVIFNLFFYVGIKREKVQEFEMILLLQPLVIIMVAVILLRDERNWTIFIPAFIAALVLIIAHIRKDSLRFDKYSLLLLLVVLTSAFETVLLKELMAVYSALALYFIRVTLVLPFLWLIMRPKFSNLNFRNTFMIFITAALAVLQLTFSFWSYFHLSIVYTMIGLVLGPVLIYFFAAIFLKEKLLVRNVIAAIIILVCVIWATIIS